MPAGMRAQEAARQVSTCSDKVAQRTQAQMKDLTSSVSRPPDLSTPADLA